jgi:hypothetical protein
MKNPILRVLISAILFSLIAGIVVSIIGLMLGWKTYIQFSDGFFWAGTIFLFLGCMNLMGMFSQRTDSGLQYHRPEVHMDAAERSRILEADILHGYSLLALLGTTGLLLFGLSGLTILVGRQF